MLLEWVKRHAIPMGSNAPWGEISGWPAIALLCRIYARGQRPLSGALADTETAAVLKKFNEFSNVVFVEWIVRRKVLHFALAITGVAQ